MNRIRSEVGHLNPTEFPGVGIDGVRAEVSVAASVRPRWMTITVATALLDRGGVDRAALRRAEAEVARSLAMVDDTEQTLLLRAVAAYLDVIRAKRTVTLRETALAAFEARAGETKTRRAAAPERGWVRRPMRAHGARTSCSPRSARRRNRQRPPGMNCTRPDNDTRLFRPGWRHHARRSTEFVARPKSASARHESSWTPNGTWCRAR